MKIITALFSTLLGFVSVASAQLALNINTPLQELSFTGSDSGSSLDLGGAGFVFIATWENGTSSGSNVTLDVGSGFSTAFSGQTNLYIYDAQETFRLVLENGSSFSTIAANGTAISYAGLSQPFIEVIEASNGQTLILDQGTGFSDVGVAVPEPGHSGLALGLAVGLLVFRRRASR